MAQLAREPHVVKLAKDLGLSWRSGDCLAAIRAHALAQIEDIKRESPIEIGNLDDLRRMVVDKLRIKLEFINDAADIERIATHHANFHPDLRHRLAAEFVDGDTEGITLDRHEWDPRFFRYLAVVDARGERAARAYFTAWHEIAHMLVHPPQIAFPGFRRTIAAQRSKDPIESVVDHIAGRVAFHPPFLKPALDRAIAAHAGLTFEALEAARNAAAPTASMFATAMGSIHVIPTPIIFVTAGMALKAEELRLSRGSQQTFPFASVTAEEKLRVTTVASNDTAAGSVLAIRRNMRVPNRSVLAQVHASSVDVMLGADEDQNWWEVSGSGPLTSAPIRVEAMRRGRYVYGLITPFTALPPRVSMPQSTALRNR